MDAILPISADAFNTHNVIIETLESSAPSRTFQLPNAPEDVICIISEIYSSVGVITPMRRMLLFNVGTNCSVYNTNPAIDISLARYTDTFRMSLTTGAGSFRSVSIAIIW